MIYELRVYHAAPGKLPALIERFANHTVPIWKTHDFRPVGFWTVDIGENTNDFYYMLEWDDMNHRDRASATFMADPKWLAARAASEKDGPLRAGVSRTILKPTEFSKLK
jgi:hypothetical protein